MLYSSKLKYESIFDKMVNFYQKLEIKSFLISFSNEMKLILLNLIIRFNNFFISKINFFINIVNNILLFRRNDNYIVPVQNGNNSVLESTSVQRIRFSPLFELFFSKLSMILLGFAMLSFFIMLTYGYEIETALAGATYLENSRIYYSIWKSITIDLLTIISFVTFFSIGLMSASIVANTTRKKEDRHFLIIGIDIFFALDFFFSTLFAKENSRYRSISCYT